MDGTFFNVRSGQPLTKGGVPKASLGHTQYILQSTDPDRHIFVLL